MSRHEISEEASGSGIRPLKGTGWKRTRKWLTVMAWSMIAVAGGSLKAGNLAPTNAPGPTMHTLEEIYQQLLTTQQQVADLKQRMAANGITDVTSGMVLIPAGSFEMGDCFGEGDADEQPRHTVTVSAFYMDQYEVTKSQWDEVYNWAISNGYSFVRGGSGKASSHPVQIVRWYDCAKWCNARSQKEGLSTVYRYVTWSGSPPRPTQNTYKTGERDDIVMASGLPSGYRLPTEAEWEKAARGGATGRRFPWSGDNTIQHGRANYVSSASYSYDTSPTRSYNPSYTNASMPYTSPVGAFSPNGYGLYDMAGNVWEWCWDWTDPTYYANSPSSDPMGPDGPLSSRVLRGGSWMDNVRNARAASRYSAAPTGDGGNIGFRCARSL
jgi:sulfatase modifying factor 1